MEGKMKARLFSVDAVEERIKLGSEIEVDKNEKNMALIKKHLGEWMNTDEIRDVVSWIDL